MRFVSLRAAALPLSLVLALGLAGCSSRRGSGVPQAARTPEEEGRRLKEEERFRRQIQADIYEPRNGRTW